MKGLFDTESPLCALAYRPVMQWPDGSWIVLFRVAGTSRFHVPPNTGASSWATRGNCSQWYSWVPKLRDMSAGMFGLWVSLENRTAMLRLSQLQVNLYSLGVSHEIAHEKEHIGLLTRINTGFPTLCYFLFPFRKRRHVAGHQQLNREGPDGWSVDVL